MIDEMTRTMPERDARYLETIERLAQSIRDEAVQEEWLSQERDARYESSLHRAIHDLVRQLRTQHDAGDGCLDRDLLTERPVQ